MTEQEIEQFKQQVLAKLREGIELAEAIGEREKLKEFTSEYERVETDDVYFRGRYLE